jgi:hypothetical protein
MAEVVDDIRWKKTTGSEGNTVFVLDQHKVTLQADPNTGTITKTEIAWEEVSETS